MCYQHLSNPRETLDCPYNLIYWETIMSNLYPCSCVICSRQFSNSGALSQHSCYTKQLRNPDAAKISLTLKTKSFNSSIIKWKEYYSNPKICNCGNVIDWFRKSNKFCSSSCGASYSNKLKSADSREKQRISLFITLGQEYKPKSIHEPKRNSMTSAIMSAVKTNISFTKVKQCTYCKKYFSLHIRNRTTCSDECHLNIKLVTNAGIRKQEYNGIIFDSGWEVTLAKWLDLNNFIWIRPTTPVLYTVNGKDKRYFPDFYLPEHNLYLDPKNPIIAEKQKEKIEYFSNFENFIIGDLDFILARLEGLKPSCVH